MADRSTAAALGARNAVESVDKILAELDLLAAGGGSESEFFSELAARLSLIGCQAAIIWIGTSNGGVESIWQSASVEQDNVRPLLSESQLAAITEAIESGQPRIFERSVGGTVSSSRGRSLVAPWSSSNIVRGALQVWIREQDGPSTLAGCLQLLAAAAELVAAFLARQEHRRLRSQLDRQSKLDAFIRGLHETLDLDKLAYKITNDGRILLGCDRVSVAVRRGGSYKIIAVSGADHVHRRSDSVAHLLQLCKIVLASGESFWFANVAANAEGVPPQIHKALASYLDVSPATAVAILPFTDPNHQSQPAQSYRPIGALIAEQFNGPFDPELREISRPVVEHSRLALDTALRLRAIPSHRLWLSVARDGWLGRWATRTVLLIVLLTALAAVLFGIQTDVRIKALGELQPVVRQHVFAPRDGIVTALHVNHGQRVAAGDTLLEMRSPELDLEIQRVAGELETVRKRLAAAQSERLQTRTTDAEARLRQRRLTAEEEQFQQQVRDLGDRQSVLAKQKDELTIKSPIPGEVITWNVQQQLASRPLGRGDELLTVADVGGPWQLEIKVPSRRAGRLLSAWHGATESLKVSFMLATEPGRSFDGTLREIAPRLETDEGGESYMLAKVDLAPEMTKNPTPSATAIARIACGRGSLAEAWFHDFYDAVLLWMPF